MPGAHPKAAPLQIAGAPHCSKHTAYDDFVANRRLSARSREAHATEYGALWIGESLVGKKLHGHILNKRLDGRQM